MPLLALREQRCWAVTAKGAKGEFAEGHLRGGGSGVRGEGAGHLNASRVYLALLRNRHFGRKAQDRSRGSSAARGGPEPRPREKGLSSEPHCHEGAGTGWDPCSPCPAFLSAARQLKQVWILKSLEEAISFNVLLLQVHTLERLGRGRLAYPSGDTGPLAPGSAQPFSTHSPAPDGTPLHRLL